VLKEDILEVLLKDYYNFLLPHDNCKFNILKRKSLEKLFFNSMYFIFLKDSQKRTKKLRLNSFFVCFSMLLYF